MHNVKLTLGAFLKFWDEYQLYSDRTALTVTVRELLHEFGEKVAKRLSEGNVYTAEFVEMSGEEQYLNCSTLFSSVRLTNFQTMKPMWRRHLHISKLVRSHKVYQHILWLMIIKMILFTHTHTHTHSLSLSLYIYMYICKGKGNIYPRTGYEGTDGE
jgi:hypothetical protein